MNDSNIMTCAAMIEVCTSYANVKGDFQSSLNALPLKQVSMESERLKRDGETRNASHRTGEAAQADVNNMATSDDLCATIVTLIANAMASASDPTCSMRTAALMSALGEFDWAKLSGGTLDTLCYTVKTVHVLIIIRFNLRRFFL